MADGTLTMGTAGVVQTQVKGSSAHVQVVRDQPATGITRTAWSATAAGSASVLSANADRVTLLMVSRASVEVWIRFDGTIPTSTTHDWYLSPGDRWEVPARLTRLAMSLAAASDGGTVLILQGTDA